MGVTEFDSRLNDELRRLQVAQACMPDKLISLGYFGFIGFNDNLRKIVFKRHDSNVDYIYHYETYDYDQLFDAEIVEKSTMSTSGSGGISRAVVGGLLFGGVGAIVGAATARQTATITASQDIVIYMKVSDDVTRQYRIPGNQDVLRKCREILEPKYRNASTTTAENVISEVDAILKFKELLDAGLITEDEFQQKKAQILGL